MLHNLTAIIPYKNEGDELTKTVDSIQETSDINIVVVDDNSKIKSEIPSKVTHLINRETKGIAESIHIGLKATNTKYFMIFDGHMRFEEGWSEKVIKALEKNKHTALCTVCESFEGTQYYGAYLEMFDYNSVIEPKWRKKEKGNLYEIPCILGANYGFNREWFDYLKGLKGLRAYGSLEPYISLKSWMAGGNCKILTDVVIKHKFREKAPYKTSIDAIYYNKLLIAITLMPERYNEIKSHLRNFCEVDRIEKMLNISSVVNMRDYYTSIFTKQLKDIKCK